MNPNLVATQDLPADVTGCIVWWRLQGNIDLAALAAVWDANGLHSDWLLEGPSPATALRRAVNELKGDRRLVRPLKLSDGAGGWAIVSEEQQGAGLQHKTELVILTDSVGRPRCEPKDHPEASRVQREYLQRLEQVEPGDIGPWLCKLLERIDGIALRDRGGVYFVPRDQVETWRLIVDSLRAVSPHVISQVPAVKGEDAVAAFLDAALQEARDTCTKIMNDLACPEGQEHGIGKRAIESRLATLNHAREKLARYENLLGVKAPAMHESIDQCHAHGSLLLLQAEQESEAARGK